MDSDLSEVILINPRRGKNEKLIPSQGILLVNPSEASTGHAMLQKSGGETRWLFNSSLTVSADERFFLAGPAIGAPMAAMTMEKLIALGAQRVILFGWCGTISSTLQIGDIIIPHKALSGEGTSQYYPQVAQLAPTLELCCSLRKIFCDHGLITHGGCVWSTDAVYRESRTLLQRLHVGDQVDAVDMEFSALCAVSRFRNIDFAAILVTSDDLTGLNWQPGFTQEKFVHCRSTALKLLIGQLGNLE